MRSRLVFIAALATAILLGGAATAQAVSGSSLGTGQVSVESVWTSEAFTFNAVTQHETIDVDCPSGEKVISGFGIWVDRNSGVATSESGSALDSDTWRVSFNYGGSQSLPSTLQAHAVCV